METIELSIKGTVALIRLSRPQESNQIDQTMAAELREACQQIRKDATVRAAILTGSGQAFSVGRQGFSRSNSEDQATHADQWLENHRVASALAGLEIPLIAALNGDAVDHGLELALACDLRVATEDARLGFTDLAQGTIPWDGGTQRLARVVGRVCALEMLLTGRLVDAQEAQRIGLVNTVVPKNCAVRAAGDLTREILDGAPVAVRYTKEAVYKGMDLSLGQGLRLEADLSFILQSTRDRQEGVRSFLEKRKPQFTGE